MGLPKICYSASMIIIADDPSPFYTSFVTIYFFLTNMFPTYEYSVAFMTFWLSRPGPRFWVIGAVGKERKFLRGASCLFTHGRRQPEGY